MNAPIDALVSTRQFAGKRPESPEAMGALAPEAQAGLRQYSLERMMGYGVDYADAIEFRARVLQGEPWKKAALAMAESLVVQSAVPGGAASAPSQAGRLHRASALFRIGQALMLVDGADREEMVGRAVDCYGRFAELRGDRRHVRIETQHGPMAGWFLRATRGPAVGSAIVIGGIEGWAMDFDCIGEALACRGVNALLLDAPGQGETRIIHRHHLSPHWLESFRCATDFAQRQLPAGPIGIVGNSMGGSIAMAAANDDSRIVACCDNGGSIQPSQGRAAGATFLSKMVAFCGAGDEDRAMAIWDTVEPVRPGANTDYALLVIQGGHDPLISVEHGKQLLARAPVTEKRMELFSDGDHCIYNHRSDRDMLISDWMRERLCAGATA
jgi:alpha-beta hydrolase superfamily lysophospholipase